MLQIRVAKILHLGARQNRNYRYEIDDFVQEIVHWMFDRDCRVLRAWNPNRHTSLETFAGILARNRVYSILRSRRRSSRIEGSSAFQSWSRLCSVRRPDPEQQWAERELLQRVLDRLAAELDQRGVVLFHQVILAERTLTEVCMLTGMSRGAIYTWKSRTSKRAREIANDLLTEPRKIELAGGV